MHKIAFILLTFFALLGAELSFTEAYAADSYQLNNAQQAVIDEHGVCRVVTNNSGLSIFIPTKTPGEWSAFYNNTPGGVAAPVCASCTLDGMTVAHNNSGTFYLSTRPCYASCGSISQSRYCYNGNLDGSATYNKSSCPAQSCASCPTSGVNWTTSSFTCTATATAGSHNTTRNLSDGSAPNVGSSQFVCANGTWNQNSGSCGGASCTLPWGGSINHNQSTTAYLNSSEACGGSCTSQARTCNNGSLSGTYTNQSCSVTACASCSLPWGGSINHNQSTTAYQSSSVACGGSCTSQNRTCNNGSLSGSYTNSSCSVGACGCTLPWGGSINHGQSVTAYQASSVPCGNSCTSQSRSCNNGSLSGSYTNQSCSVGSCGCTTSGGVFIANGQCTTLWNNTWGWHGPGAGTGGCSQTCASGNVCCNNGNLSNTVYKHSSCSTDGMPCCGGIPC